MVTETWGNINGYFVDDGKVLAEYLDTKVKNILETQPDNIIIDNSESMVLSNRLTLFLPEASTLTEGGGECDSLKDGNISAAENVEAIKTFIKDVYTTKLKPLFPFLKFEDEDIVECPIGLADVEGLANTPPDPSSDGPNNKELLRGEKCLYSGLYDKIEKRGEEVGDPTQGFPYLQYSVESIDIQGKKGILTDQFQINLNEVSQKYEIKPAAVLTWVTNLRTQNIPLIDGKN